MDSAFCRQNDLVAEALERFPYENFVFKRPVAFGRVEECDPKVESLMNEALHLLLRFGGSVAKRHAHAAEAESGDFESGSAKRACLHFFL